MTEEIEGEPLERRTSPGDHRTSRVTGFILYQELSPCLGDPVLLLELLVHGREDTVV